MPGHGSMQQDFDFAWAGLAQTPFKFTAAPGMQPKAVLKGWQFLIGNTKYNDNGVATLAMLISFSGGNNMQAICILSNSDSYKKDIEDFLASVDVSKDIARQDQPKIQTQYRLRLLQAMLPKKRTRLLQKQLMQHCNTRNTRCGWLIIPA